MLAGKYEVVRELGRGAFGLVVEAHDRLLDRAVAIKTIATSALDDARSRQEYERRFLREARAAARLSHPNIVALYEAGTHEGAPYIVMEYVRGATLRQILDRHGSLPVEEGLRLAEQLLLALDYAHGAGIVHRDVKAALGWATFRSAPGSPQGRADSVRLLQESLRLAPHDPATHISLARVARMDGELARAREHVMEALRLDPGHAEAQAERVRLEGLGRRSGGYPRP